MKKFIPVITTISTILLFAGCGENAENNQTSQLNDNAAQTNSELQEQLKKGQSSFDSEQYSLTYNSNYTPEKPTEDNPVLTLKSPKGRLELFKPADFAGQRIHGYSGTGIDEYEADLVPKKQIKKHEFEIWLFYKEDDLDTRNELMEMQRSINFK